MTKICELCGLPFEDEPKRRGRPRVRHPQCNKIEQLLVWLDTNLSDLKSTPEKEKAIRSRIWSTANLLN